MSSPGFFDARPGKGPEYRRQQQLSPVIPVVIGDSLKALRLSQSILRQGIDALPMVYPAVPDNSARLRFLSIAPIRPEQIRFALDVVARELEALQKVDDEKQRAGSCILGSYARNPLPLITEMPAMSFKNRQDRIKKITQPPSKEHSFIYLHYSALGVLPTGLETPQPSSGGVGIIFTT